MYPWAGIEVGCTAEIPRGKNISNRINSDGVPAFDACSAHSFCPDKTPGIVQLGNERIPIIRGRGAQVERSWARVEVGCAHEPS